MDIHYDPGGLAALFPPISQVSCKTTELGSFKPRLLVLEDDGLIRLDLIDMLCDQGYAIDEASTADEALQVLGATADFAAVLTAIHMRGTMNGLSLANVAHER
ncbi:response regulator [Rhizobium deserti]|uniref:Response regulator n=1 Tax=Rhizobium deserti TaxID=2547961 RepID=A0A4R5U6I6_9HYPH|nr:response regulator [Rhizobium deserti]TDK29876.1 response regulator [Rhizobium deserti]